MLTTVGARSRTWKDRQRGGKVGDDLARLKARWGRWYLIEHDIGWWHAMRRDDNATAHRRTADALDQEIEQNYLADPVIVPPGDN